tara:strand:- start:21 stop:182 length:162 start_codon:yes stop_codon:yes gene_type:complete
MNGATTVPSLITSNNPKNIRKKNIGRSHHFFLILKKSQNSTIIDSFDIFILLI